MTDGRDILIWLVQEGVVGVFLSAVLSLAEQGLPLAEDIKASYKLT